jgi:uncharacterized protein (DUF305 family)
MVDDILTRTRNSDVLSLAQSIKDGQQKEITIFSTLLTSLNAKPLP